MMVFTHVLLGALVGAVAGTFSGASTTMLVIAGAIGGGLPDLDMAWRHRRALHFPFLGSSLAILTTIGALLRPTQFVVASAVFAIAFALHPLMDVLGGGKELRPWHQTDDRAVYDHVRRRWFTARRFVYDGSPGDLAICAFAGIAVSLQSPSRVGDAVGVLLVLATAYAVLRREITRRIPGDVDTYESWLRDAVR